MLDSQGQELWIYPFEEDHTDEIMAGKFRDGDERGYFACVSGTQGTFIGDFHGNVIARDRIGHAQRVSVANYGPERKGFELAVTNFWGRQGVIYLYGSELILTNADPKRGGLINGNGVRAVEFPDDGHPVMCCQEMDLTCDGSDR